MTSKKPATIKDIAQACDVSRWSVSAILFPTAKNQHVGASEETRIKVLAAAKRLNYRPHRSSRTLKTQSHQVIGVLCKSFFNIPWPSMHAMLDAAKRHGQVISLDSYAEADPDLPVFLRENVVDGLIFYDYPDARVRQAIARHRMHAVYVNTSVRGQANSINMDEAGAMERAVEQFVLQRRQSVSLIIGDPTAPYEKERIQGLTLACARHRLTAPRLLRLPQTAGDRDVGYQALAEALADRHACDAIIAPHDAYVGMIYRFCAGSKRSIPDELSVVCMQNPDRLMNFEPAVSAFELPEVDFGRIAVDKLNHLIAGGRRLQEQVLEYRFFSRGSA